MRTWIGDQKNLQVGDVITAWSLTDNGDITFEVQRRDVDTAKSVLARIDELRDGRNGTMSTILEIVAREFRVQP